MRNYDLQKKASFPSCPFVHLSAWSFQSPYPRRAEMSCLPDSVALPLWVVGSSSCPHLHVTQMPCSKADQPFLRASLFLSPLGLPEKIPYTGWLKQHTFISHSLEAGSLRADCPLGSGESYRVLFLAGRWPPPHSVLKWWRERRLWSNLFLVKTLFPSWRSHTHDFLKATSPDTITFGVGLQQRNWGGTQMFSL